MLISFPPAYRDLPRLAHSERLPATSRRIEFRHPSWYVVSVRLSRAPSRCALPARQVGPEITGQCRTVCYVRSTAPPGLSRQLPGRGVVDWALRLSSHWRAGRDVSPTQKRPEAVRHTQRRPLRQEVARATGPDKRQRSSNISSAREHFRENPVGYHRRRTGKSPVAEISDSSDSAESIPKPMFSTSPLRQSAPIQCSPFRYTSLTRSRGRSERRHCSDHSDSRLYGSVDQARVLDRTMAATARDGGLGL